MNKIAWWETVLKSEYEFHLTPAIKEIKEKECQEK
jgi:hypothetical protein